MQLRSAQCPCCWPYPKISASASLGLQVGKGRLYTPCAEDVGTVLKCEVVAIDSASAFGELGKTFSVSTSRVRPAPSPPKRSLTPVPPPKNVVTTGKFTALTYNLLADLYATVRRACRAALLAGPLCGRWALTARLQGVQVLAGSSSVAPDAGWANFKTCFAGPLGHLASFKTRVSAGGQAEQFSYCQPWMLAWGYRKQNLLKELLAYRADILCLQARCWLTVPVLRNMHFEWDFW